MQLKIQNGVVELSGEPILSAVNIEINDTSKIAVVGRNGCGKTTLLKLISGEYTLAKKDSDEDSFIAVSGKPVIGVLSQMTFDDESITLTDEIRKAYSDIIELKSELDKAQGKMELEQSEENIKSYTALLDLFTNRGGFYFEREYEAAIKRFGFTDEQKNRPLSEFSGGQRTKIAFLKLLLSKPDILLLDEPTNHLDIEAVEWLEEYLKSYKKAFVVVSHDRMFLDNVVDTVYEIEYGQTHKYAGNYTQFTALKKERREQQAKEYEAQKKEIARLTELVEKFRYKPTKAAMAQSKLKQLERMKPVEAPLSYDMRTFHADFEPDDIGVKDVLSVEGLEIGYREALSVIDLDMHRGDRVGIIGGNGLGKSTFIKTLIGAVKPLSGEFKFGPRVSIGYFDQQMALYSSPDTVLADFLKAFPSMTDFEARSALGAFLFSGEDVFKTVDMLSGGERVRLALCKIFKKRPNFLILDEPTNHMDIVGKETLEEMLSGFSGTVLFVSHDRYFIRKISNSLLSFESDGVKYYPYGYAQYLDNRKAPPSEPKKTEQPVKQKRSFTTPAKERSKYERAIKKAEEKISLLEEKIGGIKEELSFTENQSDYIKLSELQAEIDSLEIELDGAMNEWECLSGEYEELLNQQNN
ncbi:MAG: ABC-F type ribosomal protection protein [Acutalibacteraceae bacterium]|nr:ABC-F type ribosomal protection protein [Acutalibacteraceae bacterium]